jgi:hypothetical protein
MTLLLTKSQKLAGEAGRLRRRRKHVIKQACDWVPPPAHRQQIFRLYGVGKSTIVTYVIGDLGLDYDDVRFATLTGKAALVLRRTGLGD